MSLHPRNEAQLLRDNADLREIVHSLRVQLGVAKDIARDLRRAIEASCAEVDPDKADRILRDALAWEVLAQ